MNCALKDVSTCYDKNNTVLAHFEALMVLRYPSVQNLAEFDHDPAYLGECNYFDTVPADVMEMWMVSLQGTERCDLGDYFGMLGYALKNLYGLIADQNQFISIAPTIESRYDDRFKNKQGF